eukprot:767419-Hanusia_phi.AAC.3
MTAAWEMIAQFVGGLLGGILLKLALPHTYHPCQALRSLLTVVTLPAPFAPLAIGLAMVVDSFAAGPFTGGAMNPARALGPAIAFWNFKNIWVYLLATFFGGIAGAVVYEKAFLEHQPPEACEVSEASV